MANQTISADANHDSKTGRAAGEDFTITSSSGIIIENSYISENAKSVVVWVSGGEIYQEYLIKCSITTNSSPVARIDSRDMKIKVIP